MDTATLITLLGTNLIVAGVSYFGTRYQVKAADARFTKQLDLENKRHRSERKREVRSEPLLRMRAELARMAAKLENFIAVIHLQHTRLGGNLSDEEAKRILNDSSSDWNDYVGKGYWDRALFALDDTELIDKAMKLHKSYWRSLVNAEHYLKLNAEKMERADQELEHHRSEIAEIQSLINKHLEEL